MNPIYLLPLVTYNEFTQPICAHSTGRIAKPNNKISKLRRHSRSRLNKSTRNKCRSSGLVFDSFATKPTAISNLFSFRTRLPNRDDHVPQIRVGECLLKIFSFKHWSDCCKNPFSVSWFWLQPLFVRVPQRPTAKMPLTITGVDNVYNHFLKCFWLLTFK